MSLVAVSAHAADPPPAAPASPAPAAPGAPAGERVAVESLPPVEKDTPLAEYPESSTRGTHVLAGAVTAFAWYGIAVGSSLLWSDNPGADELRIPVAGPWMSLAKTGCPEGDDDCNLVPVVFQAVLATLSGVGQIGGLAVIGEGLFVPTRSASAHNDAQPLEIHASVQPITPGRDGFGLGVVGSF